MKFPLRKVVLSLLLVLSNTAVYGADAQRENPLYLEARSLWQELSSSTFDPSSKAQYGKRFGDLAQEQKQLWRLAGEVDRGQCAGGCLTSYNNRIVAWQSQLVQYSRDVQRRLPRGGVWRTYGKWTKVPVQKLVCHQTFVCVPAETIMRDRSSSIVSTPAKTVTGVCYVKNDPTSCDGCTATSTPPQDRCFWYLK